MPCDRIDPLQEVRAQRAIVTQVLRDDHPEGWTRTELESELDDLDPEAVAVALERLQEQGVVRLEGKQVSACACARHLDALELISI
jgi:hypothetical protein